MEPLNKADMLNELKDFQNTAIYKIQKIQQKLLEEIDKKNNERKEALNNPKLDKTKKSEVISKCDEDINNWSFQVNALNANAIIPLIKNIARLETTEKDMPVDLLAEKISAIKKDTYKNVRTFSGVDLEKIDNSSSKKKDVHNEKNNSLGDSKKTNVHDKNNNSVENSKKIDIHDENDKSLGEMFRAFLKEEAKNRIESIASVAKTMRTGFFNAVGYAAGILTSSAERIRSAIGITSTSNNSIEEIVNKFEEFIDSKPEKKDIELPEIKEILPQQEILPPRVIKISGDYPEKKASDEQSNSNVITSKKWGSDRAKSNFKDKITYRGNNLTEVAEHTSANKSGVNNELTAEKIEKQVPHHS